MSFTKVTSAGIGSTELVTLDSLEVINNASIGGVLTYEDVTNVDSVGIITARAGVLVGSGITLSKDGDGFFTGVVTATSYRGDGSQLTGIDLSAVTGATSDFSIADKIVHTGDTDAAIRFPTTDTVTIETGGSQRFRVDSSGTIHTTQANSAIGAIIKNTTHDSQLQILASTSNKNSVIFFGDAADDDIGQIDYDHNDNSLAFVVNTSEALRITSAGNIGVNVSSPDRKLHVGGSFIRVDDGYGLDSSGSTEKVVLDNGFITLTTNSSERLRITSAGRVGINENSPDNILHIKDSNPFIEIEGTTNNSGDVGIFLNANGNHWQMRADNNPSSNAFSIKSGTPASSTHRFTISDTYIDTGSQTITGGNNLALQNFRVKGVWSGGGSIGKEIELLSGYDSSVKMVALGYNLTDVNTGSSYGGDLVFHTQPLYGSPTTPIPETMRLSSSGYLTISNQPAFSVYISNSYSSASTNAGTQTMPFDTVNTNIGSHFKTSGSDAHKFVAPVAGQYFFALSQNHSSRVDTRILKNGTTFHGGENEIPTSETGGAWHHHTLTCLMTLAVGDKVHCTTNNQDGGGSYRAWNGGTWDNFSGYLVS